MFHRRRERFKFTEKTHSLIGIVATIVAALLLIAYLVVLRLAFFSEVGLSLYAGSVGVVAMVLALCCLGFSIKSLREENSFMLFPRIALLLSILTVVCWVGTYVMGFLY